MPGLDGQGLGDRGELLVGGPVVDRQPLGDGRVSARVEDQAGLEEGQVVAAPAVVAAERAEEAGQQRGAQRRLLVGERVDQGDDAAGRVVGCEAELVEDLLRDERVVQRLGVSRSGQRAADAAVQPLAVGEAAPGGRLRQGGGEVLVPLQPDDLLGEVVGGAQVGAPGRDGDDQVVLAVDVAADLLEAADDGLPVVGDPGDLAGWSAGIATVCGAEGEMTSVTPAPAVPPASSTSRSTVRWAAAEAASGSTPRSKRLDASEGSLWRRAARAMAIGSKCAARSPPRWCPTHGRSPGPGPRRRSRCRRRP
ncbi:hypothetical protein SF12_10260 [Streptomyces sp. MBRL 601]|nr:hypothetical protein SF12_10260 [Streptomyces sp. MBRL 601]